MRINKATSQVIERLLQDAKDTAWILADDYTKHANVIPFMSMRARLILDLASLYPEIGIHQRGEIAENALKEAGYPQ